MTKAKINENYPNDFIVTYAGKIFYKKGNKVNGQESILDVDFNNTDELNYLSQGILQLIEETKESKVKKVEEPKIQEIKVEEMEEVIEDNEVKDFKKESIKDKPTKKTLKEKK